MGNHLRYQQYVNEASFIRFQPVLRPKLMTAIGAIIALMPLALGIGAGAQLHQPLGYCSYRRLFVALPLLLIVLPSMMRILYRSGEFHRATSQLFVDQFVKNQNCYRIKPEIYQITN